MDSSQEKKCKWHLSLNTIPWFVCLLYHNLLRSAGVGGGELYMGNLSG